MNDLHLAYRLSTNVSRLTSSLRSTPPHIKFTTCQRFDEGMRRDFEDTHGELDETCWTAATIPLREGGLGLTPTSLIAGPAYAGSILRTLHLITGLLSSISFPFLNKLTEPLNHQREISALDLNRVGQHSSNEPTTADI